jgi:SAM-dependent methyltransferase
MNETETYTEIRQDQAVYEYDAVPYLSQPFRQTHPDRLAAISTLYGLNPPCPKRSRVLEIGCGAGDNLLPMALALPGSQFVGIDCGERPLHKARTEAKELKLANLSFVHADLLNIDDSIGSFDFIIAHGFYSWVPASVRNKMFQLIRETMSPNGVAYVSYNTYPGCYLRQILREMCLYHVQDISDPSERTLRSVEFIQFFSDNNFADETCRRLLTNESQRFQDKHGSSIYHDDLAPIFDPVYFHQFVRHAEEFGLKFVSEAHFMDMGDGVFSADAAQAMDVVARQQYLDFLRCRRFRQSILCHEAARPAADPIAGRILGLFCTSNAQVVHWTPEALLLRTRSGPEVTISNDIVESGLALNIIEFLGRRWPETATCAEISRAVTDVTETDLCNAILKLYKFDLLEIHSLPRSKRETQSEPPFADLLARRTAHSGLVTSALLHERVPIGDFSKLIVPLLDGSRTSEGLYQELRTAHEEISPELLRGELANLMKSGLIGW